MITLVLGGARSGKSLFAEQLAAESGVAVIYVATAVVNGDADFAARIATHQTRRPSAWQTVEAGARLVDALSEVDTTVAVLVDSLGTWVAATPDFGVDIRALTTSLLKRSGPTIVVSEEVGLGVHPSTAVGGRFRDQLGRVNQAVSAVAGEAFLLVAGRPVRLGRPMDLEQPD
jgi:adenosylcobinamide kinase/adenosylcobinamide-phosphate guanylyltransferase